jgi:hypothetical protein
MSVPNDATLTIWEPQPGPQSLAVAAHFVDELMYGGARGGGKSDYLLGDFLQDVWQGEKWRGIIFRRSHPELEELITRAKEIYLPLGAVYKVSERMFIFKTGATLKMRHVEVEADSDKYQGHQYTWIGWDELTNKKLLDNDPGYIARLREIGSPELVRAWLEGDWNVITGAYFPEFSTGKHVLEPFEIPEHWLRFKSGDWGTASPFCILWHTVSDGYQVPNGPYLPSGAIITYREFYGWNGNPNQGLRWPAARVAQHIVKMETIANDNGVTRKERVTYGVIDPAAYKQDGGPSVAESMAVHGAFFRKADNQRINGWNQVRERLCGEDGDPEKENGVGTPMWYVFKTCVHIIRTLPAMQHDLNNPEDADTDGEDHAPDALRYGLMSRPWRRKKPANDTKPIKTLQDMTLNDIWQDHDERQSAYSQI